MVDSLQLSAQSLVQMSSHFHHQQAVAEAPRPTCLGAPLPHGDWELCNRAQARSSCRKCCWDEGLVQGHTLPELLLSHTASPLSAYTAGV